MRKKWRIKARKNNEKKSEKELKNKARNEKSMYKSKDEGL